MMMGAAMAFAVSCEKNPDEPTPTPPSNDTEGIYLGIIGFNDQQSIKTIGLLNNSTVYDYTNFIDNLSKGNGTGLYFADYTALKMMRECQAPPKLKNVALVTFTDGLDNISLASDEYNPQNYSSTSAYRDALHNMIVNEQIHGQNVAAYTIGLKGSDVSDNNLFMETLRKLASSDNNVFQVSNMNEAIQRFTEIAANLNSVSTSVNLGVDVPGGYDDGQLLRFTFDNANTATGSSRYIEATYRRSNGRTLDNITYHGLAQGPTSISSTSSQGAYYHFVFEDLKYANGTTLSQSDINKLMLWKKTSTGNWDRESEFDPASSSSITEDRNSALIMLVLDCTTSLGDDFIRMQQAGKTFVNTLAQSNGGGDNPGGPTEGILSYTHGHENITGSVGIGGGMVYWAASFPPSMLGGHEKIDRVECAVSSEFTGTYTMTVYSGTVNSPQTALGSASVNVTSSTQTGYAIFRPSNTINIDHSKYLWIVMSANSTYPALGCDGVGNPNSNWISTDGSEFLHAPDANADLDYSWFIDCYTRSSKGDVVKLVR